MRDRKVQLKKKAFLQAFLETATVTHAATKSGIVRSAHYKWLQSDPQYKQAFEDAEEAAFDQLEAEARRRAVEGVDEPVGWHQGQAGGYVKRYSDTLLIFLMKGAKPEKYADRKEISGPKGRPIEFEEKGKAPFDFAAYHKLFAGGAAGAVSNGNGSKESVHTAHTNGAAGLLPKPTPS